MNAIATDAVGRYTSQQAGEKLLWKHYPHDGDLRCALEEILGELIAEGDWSFCLPKCGPPSFILSPNPLRAAVRRLPDEKCSGPEALARCIVDLLEKQWPSRPVGVSCDLSQELGGNKLQWLVRKHLGLVEGQTCAAANDWFIILRAVVRCEEMRTPLLRLAVGSNRKTRMWDHLRVVLTDVFDFVRLEPSEQARVTDAVLFAYPWPPPTIEKGFVFASEIADKLSLKSHDEGKMIESKSKVDTMIRRAKRTLQRDYGLGRQR